jgi:hypothetical protein
VTKRHKIGEKKRNLLLFKSFRKIRARKKTLNEIFSKKH